MISVVILTKNEEKNILDCLESISWADEVIIVDDFSEDRTLEVSQSSPFKKKLKIFKNKLNDDFSYQRNFAMAKAMHEWILFVDADERVTKDLREAINTVLIDDKNNPKYNGFFIKRKDFMWGKLLAHGETGNIKLLRLGRKGKGIWQNKVHEEWVIEEELDTLDGYFIHYPHPTVSEFLSEMNFYTTLKAKELYEKGVKVKIWDIVLYPKGKFLQNFLFKLGFLDGIEGFLFAILMSFLSFLVRGKLWILWRKK